VSPVKYELGFYISEDDILHSHRRENLKSNNIHRLPLCLFVDQSPYRFCLFVCGPNLKFVGNIVGKNTGMDYGKPTQRSGTLHAVICREVQNQKFVYKQTY
jgi:hypothetical protein